MRQPFDDVERLIPRLSALLRDPSALSTESVDRELDVKAAFRMFERWTFETPASPSEVFSFVQHGLRVGRVDTSSARYFGLFNPPASGVSVIADALAALANPQLATWNHGSFAVAMEQHLLAALGKRLGFAGQVDGIFCSGGAEANHTALLLALHRAFPRWRRDGLRALRGAPRLYLSGEAHHSFVKAARACGLGDRAVVAVEAPNGRLCPRRLAERIADDRAAGHLPFLVVGTLGTTSAGAIDPLDELADVCDREGLWFHVDGAWGAMSRLSAARWPCSVGFERADSATLDAHKWLAVPMGAGALITRHRGALDECFDTESDYMPAPHAEKIDPYRRSLQWSRRFTGLKLFFPLAVMGFDGYARIIERHFELGEQLRERLVAADFEIVNETPLPLVCFVDRRAPDAQSTRLLVRRAVRSGVCWISVARTVGRTVARACLTSYRTDAPDLDALVAALASSR